MNVGRAQQPVIEARSLFVKCQKNCGGLPTMKSCHAVHPKSTPPPLVSRKHAAVAARAAETRVCVSKRLARQTGNLNGTLTRRVFLASEIKRGRRQCLASQATRFRLPGLRL